MGCCRCKKSIEKVVVDVRDSEEYLEGHLPQAISIPLAELEEKAATFLKKEQEIEVYCRSGRRSAQAKMMLNNLGYRKVTDLPGILGREHELVK